MSTSHESDIFEMSDEEVMNTPDSAFESADEPEEKEEVSDSDELDFSDPEEESDEEDESTEDEEETDEDESLEAPVEDSESPEETDEPEAEEESKEAENAPEESDLTKDVLAPLKANGKVVKINTVEELRNLAQMGLNYTKKMQGLAPNLKLMKMLDNNGLLDEAKLARLIDLDKKRPEAIANLVKESGIDPLDLDTESAEGYKPNTYTVTNKEMELDTVLQDLEGSEGFQTTIDVVANKWDEASKQKVLDNPNIMRDINAHVEAGIYQMVAEEVFRQKALGYLTGMTDLDAYKLVGDGMHKAGVFNPVQTGQQPVAQPSQAQAVKQLKESTEQKKRAAALTKGKAKKAKKPSFSPLEMSDEEFAKINNLHY